MKTSRRSPRLSAGVLLTTLAAISLPALAACSSDGEATRGSETSAATEAVASKTASGVAAPTGDNVEVTAEPVENLGDGDPISVKLTGLNPDMGYYSAICAKDKQPGNPVPDCTGDRGAQGTQQWITKKSGGTVPMNDDGTASFELTATSKGEAVDCTQQACVLKIFGDHSEGFEDVVDLPITFAK